MLEYARWKYILIAIVLALAFLFAVPNLFGDDPALQVATKDHSPVTADTIKTIDGDELVMLRDPWGVSLQLCQRANLMPFPSGA